MRLRIVTGDGAPLGGGFARLDGTEVVTEGNTVYGLVHASASVAIAADGRATIPLDGWPPGRAGTVEVRVPGRGVLTGPTVDLGREDEQTVVVTPGGEATVRGRVVTEDGTPVAGLRVRVARWIAPRDGNDEVAGAFRVVNEGDDVPFGRDGDDEVGDARTDAAGAFEVTGLAVGTYHVSDVGPGWMLREAGELHTAAAAATLVAVPACSAVLHVRSAADGAPVAPSSLFVELWTGRGASALGPLAADLSVRWPRAHAPDGAAARLDLEARGHLPTSVVLRAGPSSPTTERTIELVPLPPGPPGSLRLRVVTGDARFLDGGFQLELRVPPPRAARDEDPADAAPWAEGPGSLVVARATGRPDGDDLVFEGLPAGAWRGRVGPTDAEQRLAWRGDLGIAGGRESSATWRVAPHGAVVFRGAWPRDLPVTLSRREAYFVQTFGPPVGGRWDGRRIALAPGAWEVSWRAPDSPDMLEEIVVEVADGADHELRWGEPTPPPR